MISLNSWMLPGAIIQGDQPSDIISGRAHEIGRLEKALEQLYSRRKRRSDSPLPRAAAIGYFTYDGAFHFGIFNQLTAIEENGFSPLWQKHKAQWGVESEKSGSNWIQRPVGHVGHVGWKAEQTQAQFEAMVRRAKEYIADGHIYQVNLAQKFTCGFDGNPYELFEHQLGRSPAPGGAFLDFRDHQILSASPELFMQIRGRHIVTRPIKGTRPRDRDPVADEQNAFDLITDPKEQAELVMITDLERNDLGQVCTYGTVRVTQLLHLERFAQVFHLVSTVEGELAEGISALSAVRACLPGGSISGAPKKRACEIIQELEPSPRGLYTGVIGYFDENGDAAFSIAIRTMLLQAQTLSLSVGAGITADSDPASEYRETLAKAKGSWLGLASLLGKPMPHNLSNS